MGGLDLPRASRDPPMAPGAIPRSSRNDPGASLYPSRVSLGDLPRPSEAALPASSQPRTSNKQAATSQQSQVSSRQPALTSQQSPASHHKQPVTSQRTHPTRIKDFKGRGRRQEAEGP